MNKKYYVKVKNQWVTKDLRILNMVYLGTKKDRETYSSYEQAEDFVKEYSKKANDIIIKDLSIIIEFEEEGTPNE